MLASDDKKYRKRFCAAQVFPSASRLQVQDKYLRQMQLIMKVLNPVGVIVLDNPDYRSWIVAPGFESGRCDRAGQSRLQIMDSGTRGPRARVSRCTSDGLSCVRTIFADLPH